ncbi:peptidase E [Haloglycomyces albus]|uniref:Type 1 glutamine amidotransferase-like domain-containing protein n=1 Tax=Haloglycomyces albus TaxID=526067 RepID=UPI00046D38F5|nr:peptidase E [Haloglycomyces albus]
MSTPTRTIITLGGGFSIDDDDLFDQYVFHHSDSKNPKVCFVGTASGDALSYIERFYTAMERFECTPSHLSLFDRSDDLRSTILDQDILYLGGGNTANLLAIWRLHNVDRYVREAYERGTVLCGISAGANTWFEGCSTDSFGSLRSLPDGLGFLKGSFCPHFNTENGRQENYETAIREGELPPGWALDDGALARFTNEELSEVRNRGDEYGLYRVDHDGTHEPYPARAIHTQS